MSALQHLTFTALLVSTVVVNRPAAGQPPPAVTAADPGETFFTAPRRVRLVAGPWTRFTLLGGSDVSVISGGGGGFVFFDHVLVMGYAWTLSSRATPGDAGRAFSVSSAGGQVGWFFWPARRLHLTAGSLVGGASATVTSRTDANDRATLSYLMIAPSVEVEASVYPGLKVFTGVGYRVLVGKADRAGVDRGYLGGPEVVLGFMMGW